MSDSEHHSELASRTQRLSRLLGRTVVDTRGRAIGKLADVVVRLHTAVYPPVTGLVVSVGGRALFVHTDAIGGLDEEPLRLTRSEFDLLSFERRDGEILLGEDILRHRLIEVSAARFVRAYDVALSHTADGWCLRGIDTRRRGLYRRHDLSGHAVFDWTGFQPLIGHTRSARLRTVLRPLRRLRPAQIADLIEHASKEEGRELLDFVHEDPDLEADVFEEVDPDLQSQILAERSDAEVAAVLARMQADDAADAIADLPQERRLAIVELLPEDRRRKVLALMGFNAQTAGGLMVPEYVALGATASATEALGALRNAAQVEGAAATSVYVVDQDGRLNGAVPLAALVKTDPQTCLECFVEPHPVHVHPDADVVELAIVMSDYNLVLLPVTDNEHRLLGVVTVDDVLETTIPEDWRRRGPAGHPGG